MPIESAEVVLPCDELEPTLAFFTGRLGFRIDAVFPADDPETAVVSGYGVRLRLARGPGAPGALRLACPDPLRMNGGELELLAPNGTRIELVRANPTIELPPCRPQLVVTKLDAGSRWVVGRAGMRYRDLIPGRQGGRFVASHIRIAEAGPVPDHVHHHRVRVQLIFCVRGSVRVVYEDQGPPFELHPGDLVLQPPGIRHRVLECSAGLEVVEVACPARHETLVDHELALPTGRIAREREFDGQRFVRSEAARAQWRPGPDGFESRDLGVAAATSGAAEARVVRPSGTGAAEPCSHDAELLFRFVLNGTKTLRCAGTQPAPLARGDAYVVPAGMPHALTECSDDLEFLEVVVRALDGTSAISSRSARTAAGTARCGSTPRS